jgi:hypothetical protein
MGNGLAGAGSNDQGTLNVDLQARDSGLVSKLKEVFKATEQTDAAFKRLSEGAGKWGKAFIDKVGSMSSRATGLMGNIAGRVDSMVDRAMNPDIPYDSALAEFNKSFAAMNVGMNVNEKETNKWKNSIIAAHFRTGESLDGMAKGLTEMRKQGVDVEKAMGTKGMSGTMTRMAKVMSVFELDGGKLATTFSTLKKTFNMDEMAAKTLGDRIFTIGKVFNIGREAVQAWPDIVNDLSKEFADMGKKAKPEDIQKFAESIVTLGGAITEGLGKPAEESLGLSRQIFSVLAGEKKDIQNMFRGMGGEIGKLGMQLAETGASADEMFALIQKDPQKFMEGLQNLAKNAEASGGRMGPAFQRLAGTVNSVLGSDATNLMQANWGKINDKLKQLPGALAKSGDAMGKAAEAAHKFVGSGNPVQAMIDRFHMKTFSLVQTDFNAWFGNLQKGFEGTSTKLSELADPAVHGKSVAGLTHRLLLMQRVGLSGLFTQTSKAGNAFGVFATQATGALGAMSKLGISLRDLPTLIGAGGPVLLAMALFDKGLRQDVIGSVKKASEWFKGEGPKAFNTFKEKMGEVWTDIGPMIDDFVSAIEAAGPSIMEGIAGMLSKVDWEGGASKLGEFATRGATAIGKLIVDAIGGFFDSDGVHVTLGGSIGSALYKSGKGALEGLWKGIWDNKATFGSNLRTLGKFAIGALVIAMLLSSSARAIVGKAALGMGKAMFAPIYKAGAAVASKLGKKFETLAGKIKDSFDKHKKDIGNTAIAVFSAYMWLKDNMVEENAELSKSWNDTNKSFADKSTDTFEYILTAAGKFADQFTGGALGDMIGGWTNMHKKFSITWRGFLLMVTEGMGFIVKHVDIGFTKMWGGVKMGAYAASGLIATVVNALVAKISSTLADMLDKIGAPSALVNSLKDMARDRLKDNDAMTSELHRMQWETDLEVASKEKSYAAADKEIDRQKGQLANEDYAIKMDDLTKKYAKPKASVTPADAADGVGTRSPAAGAKGRKLPNVDKASPAAQVASASDIAAANAMMSQQLAQMNANIASMSQRPMVAEVNLDGRKFGQAMFQYQLSGAVQTAGNAVGPR